jgi:hypothetical protein
MVSGTLVIIHEVRDDVQWLSLPLSQDFSVQPHEQDYWLLPLLPTLRF